MKLKRVLVIVAIVGLALVALVLFGSRSGAIADIVPGLPGLVSRLGAGGEPGTEMAAQSAEDIATTPPNAPSNLGAYLTAVYDVIVTWKDNSIDEDGFTVTQVREDQPEPPRQVATAGRDSVSDIDQFTTCGATYRYIVASFNEAGKSPTQECWVISIPECPPVEELTLAEAEDYDFLNRLTNPDEGGDFGVQMVNEGAVLTTDGNPNGGISNAGPLGDTPLHEVNLLASSGFSSGNTPALPGNTYVARARRPGDYVVFRVNSVEQASPLQVNLSWFYYDATGKIIAEPCDGALGGTGVTPKPTCPDGVCDLGESVEICPEDCGPGCVLRDGILNPGETCDTTADCAAAPIILTCPLIPTGPQSAGTCSPDTCTCQPYSCQDSVPPDARGQIIGLEGLNSPTDPLTITIACVDDSDCADAVTGCDQTTCSCQAEITCQDILPMFGGAGTVLPSPPFAPGATLCDEDANCPAGQTCPDSACICACPPGTDGCTSNAFCAKTVGPGSICLDCDCLPTLGGCPLGSDGCTSDQQCQTDTGDPNAYCDTISCNCVTDGGECPADSPCLVDDEACTTDSGASGTCQDCRCVPDEDGACPAGSDGCTDNAQCLALYGDAKPYCDIDRCACVPAPGCPAGSDGCTSDQQCLQMYGSQKPYCYEDRCACVPDQSACPSTAPCFVDDAACTMASGAPGTCQSCRCVPEQACPVGSDGCTDNALCIELYGDAKPYCYAERCTCVPEQACPANSACFVDEEVCISPAGAPGVCLNCECVPETETECPEGSYGCTSDAQCQAAFGDPTAYCDPRCECLVLSACPANSPCTVDDVACTTPAGAPGVCQDCICVFEAAPPDCETYEVFNCQYDPAVGLWYYCQGMRCPPYVDASGVSHPGFDGCITEYYSSSAWMNFCDCPPGAPGCGGGDDGGDDGDDDGGGGGGPPSCRVDPRNPACVP